MESEWRPVVGYETLYRISESGVVVSLRTSRGIEYRLKQQPDAKGYMRVGLTDATGNQHWKRVHILVAASFIGNRPEGLQINHIDGVKTNNHWTNLEYVTASENALHAHRTGLRHAPFGEKHNCAKMTEQQVKELRVRYKAGENVSVLAAEYGIEKSNAWLIGTGRTWKHVP